MKITFEEILSEKEWLHKELMNSLNPDIITKARDDGFYNVKLLVNGVELEPRFFNSLMDNIEKYVDKEAENLAREKFEQLAEKLNKLHYLFDDVIDKIRDEFDISEE